MTEQEKWALQTGSMLTECFRQIRFARAAELARSRRYMEATVVLSPEGRLPIEAQELDLLARIAAQQRQFDRAILFWKAALQRSPDHETYGQAIQRAEAAKRRQKIQTRIAVNLIMGAVAVLLLLMLLHLLPWQPAAPMNKLKEAQAAATAAVQPKTGDKK
jgi:hypothetical protein